MDFVRLRTHTNSGLKSRNGGNHKGTEFRRPVKIEVKINMTSKKNIGQVENKIKLHQRDSAFQSCNGGSLKPKDM